MQQPIACLVAWMKQNYVCIFVVFVSIISMVRLTEVPSKHLIHLTLLVFKNTCTCIKPQHFYSPGFLKLYKCKLLSFISSYPKDLFMCFLYHHRMKQPIQCSDIKRINTLPWYFHIWIACNFLWYHILTGLITANNLLLCSLRA